VARYKSGKVIDLAIELLCKVIEVNDRGDTIGLSYHEIIRLIKDSIPESRTSLSSLRWYASLIRSGDIETNLTLPYIRPRSYSS
jgi:hypothetical protein